MLVVNDHNKFRRFDYTNEKSNIVLGTLIFKHDKAVEGSEPQIGVVIQTHGQDEYRTDMFGNGYLGEDSYHGIERFATIEDVKKYRPALLIDLK